ncbi:hypothetical protein TUM19329_02690 [Legionella antarctica]|uniref:CopG-like ribbon-helix-helix domain-containing protein n=1 Tax=Legionella antarctica TaxID=2708020 RepID=A0A6F8T0D3_9GAMM|nr:hypothetical protein [Legionella antarctica]BCA93908.1 hypothetical protein TUM19329_02690 [Legionella antarctica]
MARNKKMSISIRTTPEIKELMRLGAERECRSIASMIEALVVNYARQHKLVTVPSATDSDFTSNQNNAVLESAVTVADKRISE